MKKLVMSVVLLFFFIAGGFLVSASNVTRSFSSNSILPCSSINVTLSVNVTGGDSFYIIDETYPNGWNITDRGIGNIAQAGHIKWSVLNGATNTQYMYTIASSCVSGLYSFRGEYGFDDTIVKNVSGESEVIVSLTGDVFPPQITLLGFNPEYVGIGSNYTDAGATAFDNFDGNVTSSINILNGVNTSAIGQYTVFYNVSDFSGNTANATRIVNVVALESNPPVLNISYPSSIPNFFNGGINFTIIGNEIISECNLSSDNGTTNFSMSILNGNRSIWTGFLVSGIEGNITARFYCTDIFGNVNNTLSFTALISNPPVINFNLSNWFNETTNFSSYTKEQLQNLINVTFSNTHGKIRFLGNINISSQVNLTNNLLVQNKSVYVNSSALVVFNKPAEITFTNVLLAHPIVKRNGVDCNILFCNNITYNSTSFVFNFFVSNFSTYSVVEQCTDGVQNYDETGVDCGGSCNSCPSGSSGGSGGGGGGGGSGGGGGGGPIFKTYNLSLTDLTNGIFINVSKGDKIIFNFDSYSYEMKVSSLNLTGVYTQFKSENLTLFYNENNKINLENSDNISITARYLTNIISSIYVILESDGNQVKDSEINENKTENTPIDNQGSITGNIVNDNSGSSSRKSNFIFITVLLVGLFGVTISLINFFYRKRRINEEMKAHKEDYNILPLSELIKEN